MGVVVGEKVARAFDAARREKLPVVTVTSSGGARMQEGMWALVQMAKTVEARGRHADAGLAHVTLLDVADDRRCLRVVRVARRRDLRGERGDRRVRGTARRRGAHRSAPPSDVHTAEFAFAHGLIDAIVDPERTGRRDRPGARALSGPSVASRCRPPMPRPVTARTPPPPVRGSACRRVRDAGWPKAAAILDVLLADAVDAARRSARAPRTTSSVVVRAGGLRGTKHEHRRDRPGRVG